jgi:hypothetical protein
MVKGWKGGEVRCPIIYISIIILVYHCKCCNLIGYSKQSLIWMVAQVGWMITVYLWNIFHKLLPFKVLTLENCMKFCITLLKFRIHHILKKFHILLSMQKAKKSIFHKRVKKLPILKSTRPPNLRNCELRKCFFHSNGAGRTGTFVTISICMERLKVEQRVDVFQCIKLIREHRPQFVENEVCRQ